ncbi:MAG: hypothetical protein HY583_03615, partial [Candidatus Omnitrophica bacterium]|nr:hypothetical protein [Candidatus Omnitrophota bacterium]
QILDPRVSGDDIGVARAEVRSGTGFVEVEFDAREEKKITFHNPQLPFIKITVQSIDSNRFQYWWREDQKKTIETKNGELMIQIGGNELGLANEEWDILIDTQGRGTLKDSDVFMKKRSWLLPIRPWEGTTDDFKAVLDLELQRFLELYSEILALMEANLSTLQALRFSTAQGFVLSLPSPGRKPTTPDQLQKLDENKEIFKNYKALKLEIEAWQKLTVPFLEKVKETLRSETIDQDTFTHLVIALRSEALTAQRYSNLLTLYNGKMEKIQRDYERRAEVREVSLRVIPAKAGIQILDPRVSGDDIGVARAEVRESGEPVRQRRLENSRRAQKFRAIRIKLNLSPREYGIALRPDPILPGNISAMESRRQKIKPEIMERAEKLLASRGASKKATEPKPARVKISPEVLRARLKKAKEAVENSTLEGRDRDQILVLLGDAIREANETSPSISVIYSLVSRALSFPPPHSAIPSIHHARLTLEGLKKFLRRSTAKHAKDNGDDSLLPDADEEDTNAAEEDSSRSELRVLANQTTRQKRLIISLEELKRPELRRAFIEMAARTRDEHSLQYIIVATGNRSELRAERDLLRLFGKENPFLHNAQLIGAERFDSANLSERALINRVIEGVRSELRIAPREFASNVAAIVSERLASGAATNRFTPIIAVEKNAGEPLLKAVLSLLDSSIDMNRWRQAAPNGYAVLNGLARLLNEAGLTRLTHLKLAAAA